MKEKLSFEEFTNEEGITPKYNNFPLFFTKSFFGTLYRNRQEFLKFKKEHSDLEKTITKYFSSVDWKKETKKIVKPIEKELYEAYSIMTDYVIEDEELFQ
ncbi:hypothetical protein CMO90_01645 [Candidatus Woesearchaeota archaeon]|jgi:hypothetical protein|nr:hypothetical protein [Candidatus Woesearchaeota archaeon]|tara:strand:- start:572 stop:871 length:300 start_codon:yes stop_codon:yes gene_type:complete